MYLHEFQAKEWLSRYGVQIAPFFVVQSLQEVEECIATHTLTSAVVKIQIHSGARGKAGGITICRTPDEIRQAAKSLLGMRIKTIQTGPEPVVVEKLMLDTLVSFSHEYYLGIVLDRKNAAVQVIVSAEGGMEIEALAKDAPSKLLVEEVPQNKKLTDSQLAHITNFLGLQEYAKEAKNTFNACVDAFFAADALLVECNPLVITDEKSLVALDAKMHIDDNALFRQPEIAACYDPGQMSELERQAHDQGLAYVSLDGRVGCMVNGAGLAMATLDLIRYYKGEPANFLDVGGGASVEKIIEGFKILFKDSNVKAILVNIFGGIMNCERIAEALIQALKEHPSSVDIVVRLEGTNVKPAKEMLKAFKHHIIAIDSFDEAAKCAVERAYGDTH